MICLQDPGEKQAFKTTILEDDTAVKTAAELWARRKTKMMVSGS
jgi:hypothetical protein